MKSGLYAACFLAAFAAATPIEHQARQISSFNQASGSGQQSTSNSQTTPWGMSSNQQSSSYSYQSSSQGGIGSTFNNVFGQLTQVVQGLQTKLSWRWIQQPDDAVRTNVAYYAVFCL
ncbi:hypothetical protein PSHT_12420 [Puccinia striiformis]|uniref:Uncharacterized protein n=1 Tax=Puccinia striiformis TaxID=27350 RepID=A0A2S4UWT9_9BASI|nr:hypothetical protein PSHT_12420 [Puccinia striiformis]